MHGGIGDVLLWIPALKFMKEKPDVLYLYDTPELELLKENGLVHEVFLVKSKLQLIRFQFKKRGFYDNIFLNHLCGGSFLLKMMSRCGVTVISNSSHFKSTSNNFIHRDPYPGIHDSQQNYLLLHGRVPPAESISFQLEMKSKKFNEIPDKYFCIHLAAGNDQTPYKNWPLNHWKSFIEKLIQKYPQHHFVFLGSEDEKRLLEQMNFKENRIHSLAGKTTLSEAGSVLKSAELFIGPDGGLMHLAVCAGIKTYTIWGGSSTVFYSYQEFDKYKHKVVNLQLPCIPCNAWLNPNTSKTIDPLKCPDFACMKDLKPDKVFNELTEFYTN